MFQEKNLIVDFTDDVLILQQLFADSYVHKMGFSEIITTHLFFRLSGDLLGLAAAHGAALLHGGALLSLTGLHGFLHGTSSHGLLRHLDGCVS